MLNELYEASEALAELGLLEASTHPNVTAVAKSTCLVFEIDREGYPRDFRILSSEEAAKLWRHSKGNHHSFPAIRVQEPLLPEQESVKLEQVEWNKLEPGEKVGFLSALDFSNTNPLCTRIRMSEWSRQELSFTAKGSYSELGALEQLVSVFPTEKDTTSFVERMLRLLQGRLATVTDKRDVDLIKTLLVGEWNNAGECYIANCMTYYDVYEIDEFPVLVASSKTRQALVKLLIERDEGIAVKDDLVHSPLSGTFQQSLGNKYPNPNLPILGLTYLYSKKADTACLTRYGLSGVHAYEIGRGESNAVNDTLAFLTHPDRKGKTWLPMGDCSRDKPNLFLAYLPDDPRNKALLARAMADPSAYESEEERLWELQGYYEHLCGQVVGHTEKLLAKNPESVVNVMILEALDEGRKQVLYQRTLPLKQVLKNLSTWLEAAQDSPRVVIRMRGKEEDILSPPEAPGPRQMIQLAKLYFRSGQISYSRQSLLSLQEIYDLYMPQVDLTEQDHAFVLKILDKVLFKAGRLLSEFGQLIPLEFASVTRRQRESLVKVVQEAVVLISILLWHLDLRKEIYMTGSSYNLGQLLQLADELHKEYCLHVRNKGDRSKGYPPQFMGGEVLPIALENPIEGLNRLDERMGIYVAWAKTTSISGKRFDRSILDRLGDVCAKIAANPFPDPFGPAERAQVFLGYLATLPNEHKDQDTKEEE